MTARIKSEYDCPTQGRAVIDRTYSGRGSGRLRLVARTTRQKGALTGFFAEGIADQTEIKPAVRTFNHGKNVVSVGTVRTVSQPICLRSTNDVHLFRWSDGVFGMGVAAAGLDLDKDETSVIVGNNIDLSAAGAIRTRQKPVTQRPQVPGAQNLGMAPKREGVGPERPEAGTERPQHDPTSSLRLPPPGSAGRCYL